MVNKVKYILIILVLLLVSSLVSATCTVVLDDTTYTAGETATATMVCDADNEKSKGYTLTWRDATLAVVKETDTGTTPVTPGTPFNEDYIIPLAWISGNTLSATLSGSQLEGSDTAIVYSSYSLDVEMIEPVQDIALSVNDVFQLTCNATNDGGGNLTSVSLQAKYSGGSVISTSTGNLWLNESGTYNCGTLIEDASCSKTWTVTGKVKSQNSIVCYAVSGATSDTTSSVKINVLSSPITGLSISLDSGEYVAGETSTATLTSYFTSTPYNVIWFNSTGGVICNESGNTPSVSNQIFYDSCLLSSVVQYNGTAVFYLNGNIDLNVTDTFNIGNISALEYVVTDAIVKYDSAFLGYSQSVKGTVIDSSSELAVGECCRIQIDDAITYAPIFTSPVETIDGLGFCETNWILGKNDFEAPKSYVVEIVAWQCSDEDLPAEDRKRGSGSTSFSVQQYFDEADAFIPVSETELFAGFDEVELIHERENNFGQPMEVIKSVWFSNVVTEQDYHFEQYENIVTTANIGVSVVTERYRVPESLPSGTYRVEKNIFYLYQGEVKEFQFVKSEEFNISAVNEVMTINSITIRDYFGNEVTTSSEANESTDMPESNYTDPHYLLTEGFGYQVCGDITNNYDDSVFFYMSDLMLHNPTTGDSYQLFNSDEGETWKRVILNGVETSVCWYSTLPIPVETSSDWRFHFSVNAGTVNEKFICDNYCDYEGVTNYFYVAAIEDAIHFEKWYEAPTNISVGIPLTFIVTQREEYLSMNDDCEYKAQSQIPWGTDNVTCQDKNDNSSKLIDYSIFPIAGEQFKVCFQIHNYVGGEIDLELYDIYLDDDSGETVIYFDERTEGYTPTITDSALYLSEAPSRAFELGGNLIDSYGIMCSKWMRLPVDVPGGNDWDIQGKVMISPDIFNLDVPVIWNWESDEFPIYGRAVGSNYPNYATVNSYDFTNVNATDGEYFQFSANVTNHLPYPLTMIFESKVNANYGALQKAFEMWDFDTGTYIGFLGTAKFTLPGGVTAKFISGRRLIPWGFVNEHEFDTLRASFSLYILDNQGNILWVQPGGFYPTLDVIGKDFDITNITSPQAGENVSACTKVQFTIFYDNIISDTAYNDVPEKYRAKLCVETVNTDEYIKCEEFELEPDEGINRTFDVFTEIPYVDQDSLVGIDIWIYSSSEKSWLDGSLVDYFNMEDDQELLVVFKNDSGACYYSDDKDMEISFQQLTVWEQILAALTNFFSFITGGVDVDTVGNYTNFDSALTTSNIGAADLQLEYNVTSNQVSSRRNLHFVYEFAKISGGVEDVFEDQNPNIEGYQALSVYQSMVLNGTKQFLLTLDPDLDVGNYTVYETIYELNTAQPTGSGNVINDERLMRQTTYSVEVDTEMIPEFSGSVFRFEGDLMQMVS